MTRFTLLGAAGFVAARHLAAMYETGHRLVTAADPHGFGQSFCRDRLMSVEQSCADSSTGTAASAAEDEEKK